MKFLYPWEKHVEVELTTTVITKGDTLDTVVSSVTSQQEGSGFDPEAFPCGLCMFCLYLLVFTRSTPSDCLKACTLC